MANDLDRKSVTSPSPVNTWEGIDSSNLPRGDKLLELQNTAKQKYAILDSLRAAKIRDEASWSSQLGVRHIPAVSTAVDLAASVVSGTSRQIGNLLNLPNTVANFRDESQITDEDKLAILRYNNNTATEKDKDRLFKTNEFGESVASRYLNIQSRNKESAASADYWDTSSAVNQTERGQFDADLSSSFRNAKESFEQGDAVTGLGKLIYGTGKSILTNPKAVAEYMAENVPQLVLGGAFGAAGKVALTATNVGYAADEYRKGVQAYMEKNNGALPTDEVRNRMAMESAALALAENVGEFGQLAAIKKAGTSAAKESAEGFLKTVAKATGKGALEEGLTEAYQTGLEKSIQGEVATGEELYKAGVIGGASGGGLSGGGSALAKSAEILGEAVQRGEEDRAVTDAVKTAIETGDYTAIRDPESPTYAPHKVVDVLIAKAMDEEVSSEEKQNTYRELDSIKKELEDKKVELEDAVIPVSDEVKAVAQSAVDAATEQLQEYQTKMEIYRPKMEERGLSTEEIDTKLNALFGDQIEAAKAEIQDKQKILDKKVLTPEESTQEIKKIDDQLNYLNNRRNELGNLYSQVKPENVKTLVDEVTTTQIKPDDIPAVEESVSKVGKILTFAMANSDNVSGEQAAKLAATEVGTTPEQRAFFGNHAKAKEAEAVAKTMQGVNKEIFLGEEKGFMGIDKYRREFANAFESTNKSAAIELYRNLQTFALSHQSKGKAIQKAMEIKEGAHIIRDAKTGTWLVLPERMDDTKFEALREKKVALDVRPGYSNSLLNTVSAEYDALKALANESRSGIKAVFSKPTLNTVSTSNESSTTTETAPITKTGIESSQQVTPTEGVSSIQTGSQETTSTAVPLNTSEVPTSSLTTEITNGTQTTETKQTEAQGQEQQQGQANVVVQESSSSNYKPRTIQNANSAGVTVAIANNFTTAGEHLTKSAAGKNKYIPLSLQEAPTEAGTKLAEFMKSKATSTLNVAGNGIYTINEETGGTQADVNQHVFDLLSTAHKLNPITQIVSGGQTGVDIAGAIAARALGIPAVITLPKGFKQRGMDGKDRNNTKEAIEKQIEDGVAGLKVGTPTTNIPVTGVPNTTAVADQDLSTEQVESSITSGTSLEGQDLFGTDPKELTDAIKKSEAIIRKVTRKNPKNLWSVLRNRMVDEDLSDTFGEGWKKTRTMLKGKAGKSLSTLIADGVLDDFLDDSKDLKNPENEAAAVEFIKEALRTGQHLTYATQFEIQTEGLKIEAIRRELESLLTIQEITDEIEYTEGTEESRVTEGVQKTKQESSTGDTARNVTKQDEEIKEEDLFDDYEFTDQEEIEVTSEANPEVKAKPKKEGKVSAISVSTKGMKIQDVVDNGKLLARYVTQKGSQLPLLQVKDFLTQWIGNKVSALDFLKINKEDLSEKQVVTIRTVRSTLPQWVDTLTSIISTEKKADASTLDNVKNIFSELISKDGSIDENVKTAMAVAGMLFLSKHGNYNPQRDTKRIIKMVGIAEDNIDWFEEKNDAGVMGMLSRTIGTEAAVQIELGNMIGDILGLENKDDRSPEDLLPRLKASMGVYALEMMKKLGMVEVATYTQSEKMEKGKVIPVTGNAINFPRDDKGIIEGEVGGLINAFTGVDNIVESLFGAEASILHPTAKPIPFKKETTQGTENEIPKALKESVSTDNASPRRADAGILTLMSGMGKALVLKVAGSLEEQIEKLPADMREAASDKHRGLESEYDLVHEALESTHLDSELDLFERDFFVQSTVLGIQRLNMVTRSLNPMASKIHRNMFYSPAWDTEIKAENTDLIDILKVSIATGIGLNPDTNHQTNLISELDARAKNDPVFSKVLPLIEKVLFPKEAGDAFVFENKVNAELLLQATPEGMMSLKALVSWAQLLHAERTGFAEPLHTNQMFGIDGKVNGTALAHASLGIDDINLVGPQTGFYPLNPDRPDSPKNFVEYATKKGLDVYQNTMSTILGMLGVLPQSYKDKYKGADSIVSRYNDTLSSVKFIVGNLGDVVTKTVEKAGRDLVKTPITALHFGSGLKSVTKSASKDFITRYLKKVEKEFAAYGDHSVKGNKEKDLKVTAELVEALNTIMGNSLTSTKPVAATSLIDLLNLELSKDQLAALREGFEDTLGDRISEGFATQFKDYLDKRNALVSGASVTYAMYMALKAQYTKEIIDKGIASGRLGVIKSAKGDTVYAAYDLSKRQKKYVEMKLGKAMPRVHTVLSKREDNVKAGLLLAKSKVGINKSSEYRSDVLIKDASGKTRKVNVAAEGFFDQSPGVNPASATIHSLESAIMQLTRAHFEGALNINDELGIGIGQAKEAANKINEYTATLIAEYNPLVEILNTGVGVLGVFAWQNESIDLMRGFVANLDKITKDIYRYETKTNLDNATDLEVFTFIESTFNNLRNAAVLGEHTKNTFLSTLGYVDQYPMEGAQYVVPDSYRAAAAERIKGDHLQPTKDKLKNTLMTLKKKVKGASAKTKPVEVTPIVAPVVGEDLTTDVNDAEDFSAEDSSREYLARTIENLSPVNALKKVLGQLPKNVLPFELLDKVGKLLPANLTITLVSEAESKLIESVPKESVKGWFSYNVSTGSNEIYLIKESFTEETVAHEIVHAALVQAIEFAKTGKHPDAAKLVKEIETLISKTKDVKGADKFKAAFENIHEFITWGLTNENFQEFLKTVEFKSENHKNSFVSMFRSLVDSILDYLFKDAKNTAVEAMFINAVGLVDLASTMQENSEVFKNIPSTGKDITLSMANQAKQAVDSYTTEDIYNALGTVKPGFSDSFDTHLRNLLGGVVKALRGPFGSLTQAEMVNQTITPLDVWTNSIVTGKAPLVSKLSKAGVRMTAQERFVAQQVEAVMNDAMRNPDVRVSAAMQEMIKLFNSAKTRLKPENFYKGNWNKATAQNKRKAEAMYNFLFNVKSVDGRSDYLGNFAALGLGSEVVNKALNLPSRTEVKKDLIGKSIADTLANVFEFLLNLYTDLASKTTQDMPMNMKLYSLVNTLVNIDAKKKNVLKRQIESKVDPILDAVGKKASNAIRKHLVKLLNHPAFSKNRLATVRATAAGARLVLEDRIPMFMNMITRMRNEFDTQKHGLAMNLFNDVKGYGKRINAFIRSATALNAEREHIASQLSKIVISGFKDNGDYLTKDDHAVITGGLLRTGAHVLLNKPGMTMKGIAELLEDDTKLNSSISIIEKELIKRFRNKANYFIHQSKGLAALMVLGKSMNPAGQLTNALLISQEANGSPNKLSETDQKAAEAMIDELSTLYAFKYQEMNTEGFNASLATLIKGEEDKEGGAVSGILEAMTLQAKLNEDVKSTLFEGSDVLMRKGYLPEIINPHTSFEIAGTDAATAKDYADRGFDEGKPVLRDPQDGSTGAKAMYVLRDGAPSAWVSGGVQLDSNKAKGTSVIGKNRNMNSFEGMMNAAELADVSNAKQRLVANTYTSSSLAWNPLQQSSVDYMVPLFNANGKIVNWRYEMSHEERDNMLERDNRVQEVISTMAATTFGKESASQQNKAIVEALHQDYTRNINLNREHFIYVSPLSEDPELKNIWNVLPYQMKKDIKEITGDGKGLWIRKTYLLPVFGYRKYSLSEIWTKEDKLNMAEEAFKTVAEWLLSTYARTVLKKNYQESEDYAKRAYIYVRRGQRAWEEIVAQVKDIVVIRTGTVMLGNIISNFSLLKANGIPMSDIIKNHHVAIKAYKQFDANSQELFELMTERKLGFLRGEAAAKESRINQLEDAINTSPIKKLIDAGLRPSIVEDLTDIDDQYSYKSAFVDNMDKYVNKINPTVRNVANQLLVTKNSELYKALSKTTQMSDFVARYVLFEHLTKRKDNPLTDKEAIFEVGEAFINYDIPMAKGLQFIDDMGFTPFVKYFMRIQRVLLKAAKDHPMQMLGLVTLNHFFSSLPLVTDSSFVTHIGNNPFRSGAGQILTVWDDTVVLETLSKLVK